MSCKQVVADHGAGLRAEGIDAAGVAEHVRAPRGGCGCTRCGCDGCDWANSPNSIRSTCPNSRNCGFRCARSCCRCSAPPRRRRPRHRRGRRRGGNCSRRGCRSIRPRRLSRSIVLADPHAAGAEIVNVVLDDPVFLAAASQPDAVRADVGNLAPLDRAMAGAGWPNHGRHGDGRLRIAVTLGRQRPIGMLKASPSSRT